MSQEDGDNQIVGMWKLIELFSINEVTKVKTYPFGDNPVGHILYSNEKSMSVIIEGLNGKVTAYLANYSLLKSNEIKHYVIQSTNKEWENTFLHREFSVENKELKISTFKSNSDDKQTSTHLLWRKID